MATAQPRIDAVRNFASRIPSGLPNYGIARGSIFLVTGSGLGPLEWQQAGFPLPVWDGVGGTTILVTVGESTVPAIMLYSASGEVAAIMPSDAPLGQGTLTLRYNDAFAAAPVTVVEAAFGIFTQNRKGSGAALAYNTAGGTDPVLNTVLAPARPGQVMALQGTGAGAIAADETQLGLTNPVSTSLKVWVGNREAAVHSAARGAWIGGHPGYALPEGATGWDIIRFTVPEGVSGCYVPVAVQAGGMVSNFAHIAIAPAGLACADPHGLNAADLEPLAGQPVRMGVIGLHRDAVRVDIPAINLEVKSDSGSATFQRYDSAALSAASNPFKTPSLGTCTMTSGLVGTETPAADPVADGLDAGAAVNVRGHGVGKQMQRSAAGTYAAIFGAGTSLPFPLPGAPPPFLEPGRFDADNGAGGADVRGFTAMVMVPAPLVWTNRDQTETVDRAAGLTVTWSGGEANAYVTIAGRSANSEVYGAFVCTEQAGAGQFTVPPFVTLGLPASPAGPGGGAGTPSGTIYVGNAAAGKLTVPDLDLAYFTATVSARKNMTYR
jgi:uncharacterized protein (TIGR03437 family)